MTKDYGLILYKYMQNGSLNNTLHEISPPPVLPWDVRYNVALGTAEGLTYLHQDCYPAIVHRDIKPNNILLDSDMEAHISDFGIAKLMDQSSASIQSISIAGTTGYIAPENAFSTIMKPESDVYSYGVVLLELLTRKKAVDTSFPEGTDIVRWVNSTWINDQSIENILDSSILDKIRGSRSLTEEVTKVLLLALQCT
ncbi:hypothetical protein C5167_026805 [Papaver somniferum]|nr:hypothetical protein C5167_026805 [Papaver somniferum]